MSCCGANNFEIVSFISFQMDPNWLQEKNEAKDAAKRAEDDMKEAKNDMKEAKNDMKEAKKKYEKADEAFEKWKETNPNYSTTNEKYIELEKEVLRKENVYLEAQRTYLEAQRTYLETQRTYKSLIETYHDLVKKIPNEDIKELITSTIKRTLDDSITSDSNKRSSRNSRKQTNFRDKVKEICDNKCVITGNTEWQACHIIPIDDWRLNYDRWVNEYLDDSFVKEDGIYDVKNGIGMCKRWHDLFDLYCFTIKLTIVGDTKKYHMELSPTYKYDMDEREAFDGKELIFSGDSKKWPGEKFLAHHNRDYKIRYLQGGAEPQDYSRQDSNRTLDNHFENRDYGKTFHWIEKQPSEFDNWVEQDLEMVE